MTEPIAPARLVFPLSNVTFTNIWVANLECDQNVFAVATWGAFFFFLIFQAKERVMSHQMSTH